MRACRCSQAKLVHVILIVMALCVLRSHSLLSHVGVGAFFSSCAGSANLNLSTVGASTTWLLQFLAPFVFTCVSFFPPISFSEPFRLASASGFMTEKRQIQWRTRWVADPADGPAMSRSFGIRVPNCEKQNSESPHSESAPPLSAQTPEDVIWCLPAVVVDPLGKTSAGTWSNSCADGWNGRYRPEHDVKLLPCSFPC